MGRAAAVPCEGQALALRGPGRVFFRCLARDRPSRYGAGVRFFRSAGGCPPRGLQSHETRTGTGFPVPTMKNGYPE